MQKKDKKQIVLHKLFIVAFFAMLILPYPLYWLFGSLFDNASRENRELFAMPTLATPIEEMPAAFEDFLNDHAAFRSASMRLNASINYKLFGVINSAEVLKGAENWLFYKNVGDSSSIDDYQGLNEMSYKEMAEITELLIQLQYNLSLRGTDLVLMLPPNKENVYSQYMPAFIPKMSPLTRTDILVDFVKNNSEVKIISPKAELISASADMQTYYKLDTHWNSLGAYIACCELYKTLDIPFAPLSRSMISLSTSSLSTNLDLANLSTTYHLFPLDDEYYINNYGQAPLTQGEDSLSLLLLHDSFGNAMQEHLRHQFAQCTFIQSQYASAENLTPATDVLVLEIAERYLDVLINYIVELIYWTS